MLCAGPVWTCLCCELSSQGIPNGGKGETIADARGAAFTKHLGLSWSCIFLTPKLNFRVDWVTGVEHATGAGDVGDSSACGRRHSSTLVGGIQEGVIIGTITGAGHWSYPRPPLQFLLIQSIQGNWLKNTPFTDECNTENWWLFDIYN